MTIGRLSGYHAVALCCVLQELQGAYSSGSLRVVALEPGSVLERGTLGIPVVDGASRPDLMLKVERHPSSESGDWAIEQTGTSVLVTTVQGGAWTEIQSGTSVRLLSSGPGLPELATVDAPGILGGAYSSEFGALRNVRIFRDIGTNPKAQEFFRARLGDFPAICIQWRSTSPADGATGASWGGGGKTRIANGARLYADNFDVAIVTSRLDCDDSRTREGDALRDSVLELLSDREVWRGMEISKPEGLQVLEARQTLTTPSSYIDVVRVAMQYSLNRVPGPRVGAPWMRTRYVLSRPLSVGSVVTVDMLEPQPPHTIPPIPDPPDGIGLDSFLSQWFGFGGFVEPAAPVGSEPPGGWY